MVASLDDLPDELVRWAFGFLAHGGGKAAVARMGPATVEGRLWCGG